RLLHRQRRDGEGAQPVEGTPRARLGAAVAQAAAAVTRGVEMPVIRRETVDQKPDWLSASAFGMFRVPKGKEVELHYHDADEIWFIVEGRARVASEGQEYEVGPGDMLCTGMGDEHGTIEGHDDILG